MKKGKTKQEKIDQDLMKKKQHDYLTTGHGVAHNSPGGEYGNSVSDAIGRKSIMGEMDADKNVG